MSVFQDLIVGPVDTSGAARSAMADTYRTRVRYTRVRRTPFRACRAGGLPRNVPCVNGLSELADENPDISALRDRLELLEQQAVLQARDIASLGVALSTCRTIGAAVGIVMASRKLTEDDAFALLKQASQNNNRKVRDLAAEVVVTGQVPSTKSKHGGLGGRRAAAPRTPSGDPSGRDEAASGAVDAFD